MIKSQTLMTGEQLRDGKTKVVSDRYERWLATERDARLHKMQRSLINETPRQNENKGPT